jgi:hypothetical protein
MVESCVNGISLNSKLAAIVDESRLEMSKSLGWIVDRLTKNPLRALAFGTHNSALDGIFTDIAEEDYL